jgi:hypothetical protein
MFATPDGAADARFADRSSYERFAIPYTFKPRLSVAEALIAATTAFLRIFCGSVLFGVWGAYTMLLLGRIRHMLWRVVVFLPLLAIFALAFVALMVSISWTMHRIARWRPGRSAENPSKN